MYSVYWQDLRLNSWLPKLSLLMPSESTIIREFLILCFDQWTKTYPIQSELLYNNQLELHDLEKSEVYEFGFLAYIKWT